MRLKFSPEVIRDLRKIKKKDKHLALSIKKQLFLFGNDPGHPSLRVHKLSGKVEHKWSISINMGLRMVYILLENGVAYFVDIGTHDEVYREN